MAHWEQTSEKKFERVLKNHNAVKCEDLTGGFDWYYAATLEGIKVVARFDRNNGIYEILINWRQVNG